MGYGEAILGKVDGSVEDLGAGEGAVLCMGSHPGIDEAGDGHGQDALVGDAVLAVPVDVGGVGCGAGAVADIDGAGLAVVDHDEAVTAHAGHVGLDDAEGGRGRDGGVDGVAAPLQHGHAGLGGEGVPGADHAVAAHDDGAVGLEVDAVGSVGHRGCLLGG